ncbi:MAG: metal transporter [Gemmatimonadota bacterium]|nr:metal transporter [Gemmatimonadota bacterium]
MSDGEHTSGPQGVVRERSGWPLWLRGVLPLVLLGVLLAVFFRFGPLGVFRAAFPPVEELTIERVAFPSEGMMRVHVVNGGPEPVTIRQVMVEEAYWDHSIAGGAELGRLERTTVDIPYPWVHGEPLGVTLLSETGVTFHADVPVATRSPRPDARYLSTFAMIGIYVGVIPVFLGLLWLPFLRRIPRRWLDAILAFTLGLLVFLGIDALAEAIELAEGVASAFQGIGLVTLGLLGTPLLIESIGGRGAAGPRRRSDPTESDPSRVDQATTTPLRVAFLVALGIGLHNLGEGLAIGASYTAGEIALGTGLVVGFLVHNTTEGVGIVAPVARGGISFGHLVGLGALAGVPTIFGTWIGGFTYTPMLTVLFLAVGAGAVMQVTWTLGKLLGQEAEQGTGLFGLAAPLNATGLLAGLCVMYLTGLLIPA